MEELIAEIRNLIRAINSLQMSFDNRIERMIQEIRELKTVIEKKGGE
jgi:prefoldin subunit 5